MNIALLEQIIKGIEADPLRFDMAAWINEEDIIAPCKTTACIAGWAVLLDTQKRLHRSWHDCARLIEIQTMKETAMNLLGLTFEQAERLFYRKNWPDEFYSQYCLPFSFERRREASILAVERIRHFIATNGAE